MHDRPPCVRAQINGGEGFLFCYHGIRGAELLSIWYRCAFRKRNLGIFMQEVWSLHGCHGQALLSASSLPIGLLRRNRLDRGDDVL